MPHINFQPHNEQELTKIARTQNIHTKYHALFITKYANYFKDVITDFNDYPEEDLEEDGLRERALYISLEYMPVFIAEIEKGHSNTWADLIADSVESKDVAFQNAYTTIKKDDIKQAYKELIVHCKAVGGDALYQKQFIYLMENGGGYDKPNQSAAIYSEAYKKQISLGRSEVFAHEYADLMSMRQYSEIGCYSQAQAYDEALKQGKSKEYATLYAEKFSNFVANNFNSIAQIEDNEDFDFGHDEIIGFMKGWEYANLNGLANKDQFIRIYQNIYLNTYYADSGYLKVSDILDDQILRMALEKYT